MKLKNNFHPRLFGFAGFSGSGKTTLIEKLIVQMKNQFVIGYIKHDAHQFSIDHQGKDTFRQYAAGAQVVFINDPEHMAMQIKGQSFSLEKEYFKDCDFILVEGHKYSDHPKILFLDDEGLAEREYIAGKITNVVASIYLNQAKELPGLPSFHRDNMSAIKKFMTDKIKDISSTVKLHGLVLAGGKSTRMGQDKALINYHGKAQAKHLLENLKRLGIPSFISCREEQQDRAGLENEAVITDRFLDFGPLGGILSAMSKKPDKAWLVLACDLPYVTVQNISELISERDTLKQATAFFNQERQQFEPLFAIYEPSIYSRMLYFLGEGMHCPQKVLYNASIKKLNLKTQDFLINANTPEEKAQVLSTLERGAR